ncbi:MAG: hypothetical protein AMS18_12845 [Gemmatimonas sp. SG8_17]|nr:MAG: hypothetical protein AMS18_12845 [Gemmatimonas sp. SG8_17]
MAKLYVSNRDESVRMFSSRILERFTHVHHTIPLVIFVPVVCYSLFLAYGEGMRLGRGVLLYVGGIAIWSLAEYVVHRFGFHVSRNAEVQVLESIGRLGPGQAALSALSNWQQLRYFLAHGVHHTHPNDSTRLVMPPIVSVPLAVVFYWLLRILLGPVDMLPSFAGLVTGYLIYDMIHYSVHHVRPRTPIGRYLKKHHFRHHFQDPSRNFGVSSPIWDVALGTLNHAASEQEPEAESAV